MIPKDLNKALDEIKTPSNRILIIGMILIIMSLAGVVVYLSRGSDRNLKKQTADCLSSLDAKEQEIKRLNKYILDKIEEDNMRLKKRELYMDSMINLTKSLNK